MDTQEKAASLARTTSSVAIPRPDVPTLTGNLYKDALALTGLSAKQIAKVTKHSSATVQSWSKKVPPGHSAFFMDLLFVGRALVGGLGPRGVQEWLTSGKHSRLKRLANEGCESVIEEAQSYMSSPAT
jgi:hypothetical protein